MALFTGNVFSKSLGMQTQLQVMLPHDGAFYTPGMPSKTLILLHGIMDNAAGWLQATMAPVWAGQYGLALVVPEVQRSFYQDMKYGLNYYSYISKELPELISKLFNLSMDRENLMIAGLSMGGYGAMKCAFGHPETFSVCGAFSSACDIKTLVANSEDNPENFIGARMRSEFTAMFGEALSIPDDSDLFLLTKKMTQSSLKPRLYQTCGTEDFLIEQNHKLRDHVQSLLPDYTYEEWPGIHDHIFWNESLRRMLVHFFGPPKPPPMPVKTRR
jgi:S-formylglutathione hydrolase FrmB